MAHSSLTTIARSDGSVRESRKAFAFTIASSLVTGSLQEKMNASGQVVVALGRGFLAELRENLPRRGPDAALPGEHPRCDVHLDAVRVLVENRLDVGDGGRDVSGHIAPPVRPPWPH